jgi:hypothetical protein
MSRKQLLGALCALTMVTLAACSRDEAASTPETTTPATAAPTTVAPEPVTSDSVAAGGDTTAPPTTEADPCAGASLEATDTGISADTITVLVMADVGSELAPGLFQGSIDGTKAWAKAVNAAGGLACRQVEVIEWDSKISATESTNGFLEACAKAAAMIGSTSLFIGDVSIIETCKDAAGAETGIADIPERAVDAQHQCSPHVFTIAGVNGSCPYSGTGPRDYQAAVGVYNKYTEIAGEPLHGIYLIPSDLPSTIASSMPTIRGLNQEGLVVSDAEFGVSGRAEQAAFAEYVAAMKTDGSNIAINGSNDQAMIKLRTEAKAQGLDEEGIIWSCSLSCYTEGFQQDPNVDGTYLWLPFLPFEERDSNAELASFLDNIDQEFPQSWAVGAWNSGRAFEQAVNSIVAESGPNGVTRASILAAMPTITDFTSNGWIGSVDFSKKEISSCFVILQLKDGKYQRVFPTEVGTLDCTETNLAIWTGDSMAEFQG